MSPVGSNWMIDPPPGAERPEESLGHWHSHGVHIQATAQMAADRAWYYRRARYLPLEPDTRRCIHCGETIVPALELTEDERNIRHPLSTNVLLGEAPIAGETR